VFLQVRHDPLESDWDVGVCIRVAIDNKIELAELDCRAGSFATMQNRNKQLGLCHILFPDSSHRVQVGLNRIGERRVATEARCHTKEEGLTAGSDYCNAWACIIHKDSWLRLIFSHLLTIFGLVKILLVELHQDGISFLQGCRIQWIVTQVDSQRFRDFALDQADCVLHTLLLVLVIEHHLCVLFRVIRENVFVPETCPSFEVEMDSNLDRLLLDGVLP